jgi:hypothetical protein
MKPSEIGLVVYRHSVKNDDGELVQGGFALAIPEDASEMDRYEPTSDHVEGVGGLAIYLFGSDTQLNAFVYGLHSAGEELKNCAKGTTSLGCAGVIREFADADEFASRTRSRAHSEIIVFDYRQQEPVSLPATMPVYHCRSKNYGGSVAASPEFMLCLVDRRSDRGEAMMGIWHAQDKDGKSQIVVSAGLDTYPGGAKTVPHIQVLHHSAQRRLFRLYRQSESEHLLIPDKAIKFKPHLMASGTMGFIVSDESGMES